jgi:DNA polymerase-3 subunit gamma/tau
VAEAARPATGSTAPVARAPVAAVDAGVDAPAGAARAVVVGSGAVDSAASDADVVDAGAVDDGAAEARSADRWVELVQGLVGAGAVTAMVRELAMQAQCLAIVDGEAEQVWRLRVERENLRAPALRERLQTAISQFNGRPARLELEPGVAEDSPALRDAAERSRRQAEAERIIHDDPLVKALMAQYKTARIVPGSIKPH